MQNMSVQHESLSATRIKLSPNPTQAKSQISDPPSPYLEYTDHSPGEVVRGHRGVVHVDSHAPSHRSNIEQIQRIEGESFSSESKYFF